MHSAVQVNNDSKYSLIMENNKDNKTGRRDSFFVLCPVRVETLDGELTCVTMPTHKLINDLDEARCLHHAGDDQDRAVAELKRLIDTDRFLKAQLKLAF